MTIQKEEELEAIKRIGKIVAQALVEMRDKAEPGMTTAELDAIGDAFLKKHGARSAPQLVYNFPGATCISVNEEAAHGIPGERVLEAGDVVNIDVSAELNGYFSDTGASFVLPPISKERELLCEFTHRALTRAISAVRSKRPFSVVGREIERVAEEGGYQIIRNLGGHGVGRALHESPKFIPAYVEQADKRRFWKGMVITLEPFLSTTEDEVNEASDGWTLAGPPGSLFAQYEHTIVVTNQKPIIVTAL